MKILMNQEVLCITGFEVTEEAREIIRDMFCEEYDVDKTSMPELTDALLADIIYCRDEPTMVTKNNGRKCWLAPLMNDFLIHHIEDSEIKGLNYCRHEIPNGTLFLKTE